MSVCKQIEPPPNITREDCRRSTNKDCLVRVIDVEPESHITGVEFKPEPIKLRAKDREELPYFYNEETKEQTEKELINYKFPVVIEEESS